VQGGSATPESSVYGGAGPSSSSYRGGEDSRKQSLVETAFVEEKLSSSDTSTTFESARNEPLNPEPTGEEVLQIEEIEGPEEGPGRVFNRFANYIRSTRVYQVVTSPPRRGKREKRQQNELVNQIPIEELEEENSEDSKEPVTLFDRFVAFIRIFPMFADYNPRPRENVRVRGHRRRHDSGPNVNLEEEQYSDEVPQEREPVFNRIANYIRSSRLYQLVTRPNNDNNNENPDGGYRRPGGLVFAEAVNGRGVAALPPQAAQIEQQLRNRTPLRTRIRRLVCNCNNIKRLSFRGKIFTGTLLVVTFIIVVVVVIKLATFFF